MSIKIMSLVWETGPADKAELFVLIALADFCNDDGECWPSVAGLARKVRMTDRGVQKIIQRLVEIGWLVVDANSGRRGCNLYRITPPNPVHPRTPFTPNPVREPPNPVPITPEPRSPEPSLTVIKPSEDKTAVACALEVWASPKAVSSFLAYRRKAKGGALTLTAALRLAEGLREILNAGFDPDDALGMAEERGWQTIKPDWYFKEKERHHGNGTSSAAPKGGKRIDPALEQIARLTGLGSASGDGRGGTGSLGEEDGSFRMGTRPQ